jgi:hypothetical protein
MLSLIKNLTDNTRNNQFCFQETKTDMKRQYSGGRKKSAKRTKPNDPVSSKNTSAPDYKELGNNGVN